MKITVNEEMNIVRILLRDTPIEESDERESGIICDYDKDGKVIGFEFLNATEFFGDLSALKVAPAQESDPPKNERPTAVRIPAPRAKRSRFPNTRRLATA